MRLPSSLRWIALALLGLVIAAAVALAASHLASQQIGIASESVSAGDSLAPPITSIHGKRAQRPEKAEPAQSPGSTETTEPETGAEPEAPAETVEPEAPTEGTEAPAPETGPSTTGPRDDGGDGGGEGGGQGGGRDD